jgi:hypothetical protein
MSGPLKQEWQSAQLSSSECAEITEASRDVLEGFLWYALDRKALPSTDSLQIEKGFSPTGDLYKQSACGTNGRSSTVACDQMATWFSPLS